MEALTSTELHTLVRTARQGSAPAPALLLARAARAQRAAFEGPVRAAAGASVDLLELSPLSGEAVRDLVRDLIGVPPKAGLLDVVNRAHGNPRLIVKPVEGLVEEGRIGPGGELLRLTPRRLPSRVRAAIDDHLRHLSEESVRLLRVGTILGRTFSLSQATAMLGTGTAALLPALDETVATGLLVFADDGVRFQQPLVWRAVYESIPEGVRAPAPRGAGARDPARRARPRPRRTGPPGNDAGAVRHGDAEQCDHDGSGPHPAADRPHRVGRPARAQRSRPAAPGARGDGARTPDDRLPRQVLVFRLWVSVAGALKGPADDGSRGQLRNSPFVIGSGAPVELRPEGKTRRHPSIAPAGGL
ncbi:hypothetical protein ACPF8X_05210 [Streptomyces sp. G35A]